MLIKSRLVTFLPVFLSLVFPIAGHMGAVLAQTLGDISGTVVGVDGRPLMGVEARLVDINTGNAVASIKTAKDGSFSFSGLKAGNTYKVQALHGKDVDSALVTVSSGPSKPVALKLSQTKGFMALAGAGGGFPVWGYVLIGLAVAGAAAGAAAASGLVAGGALG
ncbi:MAG: carboxypeptidase-like regulatory domain-containing protein [Candidatus Brocadiales bacterium]